MTAPDQPPSSDHLTALLADGARDEAVACLTNLETADADARKRVLRRLRTLAEDRPALFDGVVASLAPFLADGERAVRLTTAKSFVALARSAPAVVVPAVDALADRLADDAEFYYVRARCAEALGYVALDSPETVGDPAILADLRVGLSFDEPEVREKLAEALAHVALGDPDRLRHQVPRLADQLDDGRELVRYHLCTALVVVGCAHPESLSDAEDALHDRLGDDSPYVRGRAAEAFAVLAGSEAGVETTPDLDDSPADDEPSFVTDRVRFARRRLRDDEGTAETPAGLGTVDSVRAGTADAVEAITSPDCDGTCPNCGFDVPAGGPPTCPRCGVPF